MKKILKIFEEEDDDVELTDYQKILALNKKRIDPYYTDFDGCDGEDYSDYYEVGYDGITFTFHEGLEDYLRFFFKETFGHKGSEGCVNPLYYCFIGYLLNKISFMTS